MHPYSDQQCFALTPFIEAINAECVSLCEPGIASTRSMVLPCFMEVHVQGMGLAGLVAAPIGGPGERCCASFTSGGSHESKEHGAVKFG